MTTSAKLSALPKDHGLVGRLVTEAYRELADNGKPDPIVALVVLQPFKHASDIEGGREVVLKPNVIELIVDDDEAKQLRARAEELAAERNGWLPLDFDHRPDEEQRLLLIERIDKWAADNDIDGATLDARWKDHFGIGQGASTGVPATYEKGLVLHLTEFAHKLGAVTDPAPNDAADDDTDPPGDEGAGGDES